MTATLESYGLGLDEAYAAAHAGNGALRIWTSHVKEAIARHDGHGALFQSLVHATVTEDRTLLLVPAGLDPAQPLDAQGDTFWWGPFPLHESGESYGGFRVVVRGVAPGQPPAPARIHPHALTLDEGAGAGGPVVAACLNDAGRLETLLRETSPED